MELLATAAIAAAIVLLRKPLRKQRVNSAFSNMLAALLIACEVSFQCWYIIEGDWGVHSLPLQLCSMMVLLSAAFLVTRKRKLGDIVFFLGLLGAMQALLTPNLDVSYPHFRYFHFYIAHICIISVCVFMAAVDGYRPGFQSMLRAFVWLQALAVPAAIVNGIAGTNFMFLARKPSTASLLDWLAPWPWYLVQLEMVAFGLCLLLWAAMRLANIPFQNKKSGGEIR
ncbi:TIGR02206 family membrane protein [Paenibacillus sp. NEAU-GSW1]|uniref:YwaF family protein n=1 Tax=Paenibacillus sp. NEAU-GSW1 TaxID=2682486 RepID=UPI0012E1BD4E|nr:TIGR02206 family membrane protein [Paenibacillus sp. NEAU-GSW1]MUT66228.1 TIGR02206 family membrane protein [Paenibacillus sp. NEAU-GSW1]